jgi:hypothetical protein
MKNKEIKERGEHAYGHQSEDGTDIPELNEESEIEEGFITCSIEDIEKKSKKILFAKYNWNPDNVKFEQKDNAIIATVNFPVKEELKTSDDLVIFNYLTKLSSKYEKDLKGEFDGFCSSVFKAFSKNPTYVAVSTYTYIVLEKDNNFTLYTSSSDKKQLKHGKHKNYTSNQTYIQIGIFVTNVK